MIVFRDAEGSRCSVKAYKFCVGRLRCKRDECVNSNAREPKRMEELSQMFVMFSWAMVALFILTNLAAISYCAWRKQSRGWL